MGLSRPILFSSFRFEPLRRVTTLRTRSAALAHTLVTYIGDAGHCLPVQTEPHSRYFRVGADIPELSNQGNGLPGAPGGVVRFA